MINTRLVKLKTNSQPGYIYLISAVGTGRFKIGKIQIGVLGRLKELQTGSPMKLRYVYHAYVDDINRTEKELHLIFDSSRKIGEWFGFDFADVKECITLMRLMQVQEPVLSSNALVISAASLGIKEVNLLSKFTPIPLGWRQAHPTDITPLVRGVIVACIRAGWSQIKTIQEVFGITKSGNNLNYDLARELFQQINKSIN